MAVTAFQGKLVYINGLIFQILFIVSLCRCSLSQVPKAGRDYFFDEAEGMNISCADFCDLPTQYQYTCGQKCPDYTQKERATPDMDIETGEDNSVTLAAVIGIMTGICLALIFILMILKKFCDERLHNFLTYIEETLCDPLTKPTQPEHDDQAGTPMVAVA